MKSNVSDLLELAQHVYRDASAKCVADVSDPRDLDTLRSRVEHEGISFLTITLPQFAKDFERSLAIGKIDSTGFRSFRKLGSIPAFLRGMISHVFDVRTGNLLPYSEDTPTLVEAVRQICLVFKKVELPCSPERMDNAIRLYKEVESALSEFSVPNEEEDEFRLVSSMLWNDLTRRINVDDLDPSHSSGATADRVFGNQKYDWSIWHDRIEPYFPLVGSAFPLGIASHLEVLEKVSVLPEEEEIPVRVILVPKTLKGPRVIAAEPACMQYAQQGILKALVRALEAYRFTRGHLNFEKQSINREMALTSSASGRFVTIDLSDASDRVPRDLALIMFDGNPDLLDAIDSCRSRNALLPDGTVIGPLKKFASMGSALCFPIEAMYFYTICVMAALRVDNLSVNTANLKLVTRGIRKNGSRDHSRGIYVYGDDIIVPVRIATAVLDYLRKYNCKVNESKTFVSGNFRESCGLDAYAGYEVTPTYLRSLRPQNRKQASEILSWVATANLFYKKGYWSTAQFMYNEVERIIGPLPYVSDDSQCLGRTSYLQYRTIQRWNAGLHRFEVKGWYASDVRRTDVIEDFPALSKSLKNVGSDVDIPEDHLERSSLSHAVTLKRGWIASI